MPGTGNPADQATVFLIPCFFLLCARALPLRANADHSQPHTVRPAKISRVKAVPAGELCSIAEQVHRAPCDAQSGMDVADPESSGIAAGTGTSS